MLRITRGLKPLRSLVITSVLVVTLFITPISLGIRFPIIHPVVLQFSNDKTVSDTAKTLQQNVEGAQIVNINNPWQLSTILYKAAREVFYVGHGHEEGIKIGRHRISWSELGHFIDHSRGEVHYFAMCHSGNIETQKSAMTFSGTAEADLVALTILAHHHWRHGNDQTYIELTAKLYAEMLFKMENPSEVRFLDECHPQYWWVAKYRNIWFDTFHEYPIYAKYEHPDRLVYNINPSSVNHIQGSDFIAGHISVAMIADLLTNINSLLVASDWCQILEMIFTLVDVPIAVVFEILDWLLQVAAIALHDWVTTYVVDETEYCGWCFFKDGQWYQTPVGGIIYTWYQKVGGWIWCYVYQPVVVGPGDWPIPWITPLWTGWNWIDDVPLEIPEPDPPPDPPPGGGGGCPILSVFDGTAYQTEGLLDIHNPDGIDVNYGHVLATAPMATNHRYLLRLTEHPQTISHIDHVQLFGLLADGRLIHLPLLSAIHSELGQVRWKLWFSDDRRVDAFGADHNDGISDEIDLEFYAPRSLHIVEFIFVIEGNNVVLKV